MRRRGLLVVLWLVGTAIATGVVFQAVNVMTNSFNKDSNNSVKLGPSARATTTLSVASSKSTPSATTATTISATTEPPTEPTTAATDAPTESTESTDVAAPVQSPPSGGASSRTTARPATGSQATSATNPVPTQAPVTQAPPPPTTAPPATAPPPPPTTPPPTTSPVVAPPTCPVARPLSSAGGTVTYRQCLEASPPYFVLSLATPRPNYSATILSRSPVEVRFQGANNYLCLADSDGPRCVQE